MTEPFIHVPASAEAEDFRVPAPLEMASLCRDIPEDTTEHYRSFYENAVEGFYRTTIHGAYLRVNLALARMYGYDSVAELVHVSRLSARKLYVEAGRRAEFVRRMEESEVLSGFESEVFRRDGTRIWISESARVMRDKDGGILYFEGTVTEITRQKEAELALIASRAELERRVEERTSELREQMERFDRLISNIPGMVYQLLLSRDGKTSFTYVNGVVMDIFGLNPEEVIAGAADPFTMGHPDDTESLRRSAIQAIKTLEPWHWVGRIVCKAGSVKWIHVQSRPLKRDDGTLVWDGVVTDVTELHDTRHALQKTQKHRTSILEVSPDGILTIDAEGKILGVNSAAERTLGVMEKAIIGKRLSDILSENSLRFFGNTDKSKFSDLIETIVAGKRCEVKALRCDGSEFPVEITVSPVSMESEKLFTINLRDISARKRFEQQLRESRDDAHRANRAKSDFLSRMSHELRTPLNAILGFSQLLLRREIDPKKSEKVEFIQRAGKHLLHLINEILDLARIESGKLCCSIEEVSTVSVIEEIAVFAGPLAQERGIALNLNLPAGKDYLVSADQQRLKQILLNLVANGIKYNREGGSVTVGCALLPEESIRLTVSDNGIGIPADRLPDLFTPFERLGAEMSETEGAGIGLALSQSLAELMGSRITVESTAGVGSCFSLELPLAHLPARIESPVPVSDFIARTGATVFPSARCPAENPRHLLYIEDNPVNLRLIEDIVSECGGWEIATTSRGREGIAMARATVPDLIFLDLHLPDLRGDKVLRQLRRIPELSGTKIVVISADAMDQSTDRFSTIGADFFLTKPIRVSRIIELLDTVASEAGGLPA